MIVFNMSLTHTELYFIATLDFCTVTAPLPKPISVYDSQIILGNVNVSILNRNDKVRYKDDYEKFKLILNGIALVLSVINLLFNSR